MSTRRKNQQPSEVMSMELSDSSDDESEPGSDWLETIKDVLQTNIEDMHECMMKEIEAVREDVRNERRKLKEQFDKALEEQRALIPSLIKKELEQGAYTLTGHIQSASGDLASSFVYNAQDESLPSVSHVTPQEPSNPEQDISSAEEGDGPTPCKRKRFSWQGHSEKVNFIKQFLSKEDFSRSVETKKRCFQEGIEKKHWPKDIEWQMRVYYKVDSMARRLSM